MRRTLLISMALLPLLISEALADVVIIVRREAEASGNYVRVCDIARVEGPKEQAAEVAGTVLGPTPPKGQIQEITRWDIESRLFEMGVAAKVSFSGNTMVKVSGGGARLRFAQSDDAELPGLDPFYERPGAGSFTLPSSLGDSSPAPAPAAAKSSAAKPAAPAHAGSPLDAMPPEARERLGKAISQFLASKYKRPDIEIGATILSVSEAIPYTVRDIVVEEATDGRVPGKATLRLSVRETPGAPPRQVMVSADTEVFALAPVAAKPLYKGEVLDAKDVKVERVKMEAGKSYLPPNPMAAAGRELKRNLAAGDPLLAAEAVMGEAVKRGDYVQNIISDKGWRVQSAGKALGGGMVGDLITVEDVSNKTKYQARITGQGTVSVIGKPMTPEPSKLKNDTYQY